ncbi:MAG TPA: GrpB family protein [Gaiellales bacterium]|jgi:GrpB-like predicted nucleotidyltransferase (UPF0157 family)
MPEAPEPTHLDDELDAVLIGGRERVRIELATSDPGWLARFELERSRIADALGDAARRIEHIGSTAVPGLAAKPIIDVLVEVDDPDAEGTYGPALEAAGLELRVREPGHRMFRTPERDVHVHVWPSGSREAAAYLELRNHLRAHPGDRQRYAQVKRALAGREWRDMNYYAEAKGDVLREIRDRMQGGL